MWSIVNVQIWVTAALIFSSIVFILQLHSFTLLILKTGMKLFFSSTDGDMILPINSSVSVASQTSSICELSFPSSLVLSGWLHPYWQQRPILRAITACAKVSEWPQHQSGHPQHSGCWSGIYTQRHSTRQHIVFVTTVKSADQTHHTWLIEKWLYSSNMNV